LNHLATSQHFKPSAEKHIDWAMEESAMYALPKAKQQWVSKLATKFLPYEKHETVEATDSG